MKDREFLIWLHQRLVNVHGEDKNYDYMYKLRAIILNTDKDKLTPNCNIGDNHDGALKIMDELGVKIL